MTKKATKKTTTKKTTTKTILFKGNKMKNDFFDMVKLLDSTSEKVDDELDNLNNEVCGITNGVGRMTLQPIHEVQAEHYFGDEAMDENYYLNFLYNNTKIGSPVRNRFAVLSYAETYPVLIKSLKIEDSEVIRINNQKEFHNILKKLVNDDSVLRSVRSARNQKEAKK